MIIYGWNSKNIKQAHLENYECPSCKEKNSHLAIFSNYAHIFWIPLFPYKKSASIVCLNCNKATDEKSMDADLKEKVKLLKANVPTPKYLFSGLFLLLILVAYLAYSSNQSSNLEKEYLNNPQVGDIYTLEDEDEPTEYKYFLVKVAKVDEDSLIVSYNSFGYNGIPTKLEPEDGFYNDYYAIHKNRIREMYENDEIKKIIRDYSESSGFNRVIEEDAEL